MKLSFIRWGVLDAEVIAVWAFGSCAALSPGLT